MDNFKSGFVAIVGKTNVGKSTLINNLVWEKVSIITNKKQTTRTAIKAIVNRKNSQIIFIDTPGIHKAKTKLGNIMNETALTIIPDADVLLFIIDATSNIIDKGNRILLEKIKEKKKKTILLINKIDLIEKSKLLKLIDMYNKEYNFESIIPISAYKNLNKEMLLDEIEKHLKNGPAYYDKEEYTDQTLRQIVEETIREKSLKLLNEEIPHGLLIEADEMKLRKTSKDQDIYDVKVTIYVLKNSHKGIIIGKNGTMLKKIGMYAREDIEKILGTKINLKIWVKVKEKWQDDINVIKKFKNE